MNKKVLINQKPNRTSFFERYSSRRNTASKIALKEYNKSSASKSSASIVYKSPKHKYAYSHGRVLLESQGKFESKPSVSMIPSKALLENSENLSNYEKKEILQYQEIYYLGHGNKLESYFIDNEGYYNTTIGDHIGYRFEILDNIGKGSFGSVVKCRDHKNNEIVAIKVIKKYGVHGSAKKEVDVLNQLSYNLKDEITFIVQKIEDFQFRGHICIVFELLQINLYDFLKKNHFEGISASFARRITSQVLVALKHMHSLKIIHADIKPENIGLKHENKSGVKLIDFGSALAVNYNLHNYIQSRFYRAPEVILQAGYNEKIDIWSLGCTIVEIITGWPLFPGNNEIEVMQLIVRCLGNPPENLFKNSKRLDKLKCESSGVGKDYSFSNGIDYILAGSDRKIIDLVKRCLDWDKTSRISAETALVHPWIKGGHNS